MRTRILFLFLSCLSLGSFGQDTAVNSDTVPSERKNSLKFLPVSLAFNSVAFEYERKVNKNHSLVLGVGIPSSKPYPGMYKLDNPENNITDDQLSTMSLRLEYRKYRHQNFQPRGFYTSPYLKYQKVTTSAMNLVTPDMGTSYNEKIDMNAKTFGLGFQMGYQWMIAKRVTIDFYFLGFEVGLATLDATVTSPNGEEIDEIYNQVLDQINQMPSFWGDKFSVTKQGSNQVVVNGSSLPYPWLRSGISIGIAF